MITLYLVFTILGLAIFSFAIFGNLDHDFDMGHHFDFGHHDVDSGDSDSPGLFSIRTISAFLAGFGVTGLTTKLILDWGIGGQLLLGLGTGLVLAALAYFIMWALYTQQAGSVRDSSELIGKTAIVTTGTGNQNIGECRVDNNHYTFQEKDLRNVKTNEIVKILAVEPGLLIVVKT